jgi:hypothetical protein
LFQRFISTGQPHFSRQLLPFGVSLFFQLVLIIVPLDGVIHADANDDDFEREEDIGEYIDPIRHIEHSKQLQMRLNASIIDLLAGDTSGLAARGAR